MKAFASPVGSPRSVEVEVAAIGYLPLFTFSTVGATASAPPLIFSALMPFA